MNDAWGADRTSGGGGCVSERGLLERLQQVNSFSW